MARFIDEDFVRLRTNPDAKSAVKLTLAFGDEVEVLGTQNGFVQLRALTHFDGTATGWADDTPKLALRDAGVLKFSMVDVQQGDGMVLESPSGKIVLIDGGDNKLFARHVAARFQHRAATAANPLPIEAIIITHGDADHFDGLNDIVRSETDSGLEARKRLFLHPKRIYHNGLVKAPTKRPDDSDRLESEMFGRTVEKDGETFVLDLYDDPRQAPAAMRNQPFERWVKTIDHWERSGAIALRRVAFGDDPAHLFDFLAADGVGVEILGPFPETQTDAQDGAQRPALRFFRAPKKSPDMHLLTEEEGAISASHTVNGHSLTLRLDFGALRMILTGDLNRPSMQLLRQRVSAAELEAEIVKTPHHGSADFDFAALQSMRPVVAIISSGDEDPSKEHIHPRATLLAALGKAMRLDTGIIFNTELAAFFRTRGYSHRREDLRKFFDGHAKATFTRQELVKLFSGAVDAGDPPSFFAFERTNFGIIHLRSDGERVLVFTHSGKEGLNEAYRFQVTNQNGTRSIVFARKVTVR